MVVARGARRPELGTRSFIPPAQHGRHRRALPQHPLQCVQLLNPSGRRRIGPSPWEAADPATLGAVTHPKNVQETNPQKDTRTIRAAPRRMEFLLRSDPLIRLVTSHGVLLDLIARRVKL